MKYRPDDIEVGNVSELYEKKYQYDPFLKKEISNIFRKAEIMGIDIRDTEVMGNFLQDVFGSIKEFATGVLDKTSEAAKAIPTVTVMTEKGTTTVGPGSISFVTNKPIETVVPTSNGLVVSQASSNLLNTLKVNPALLGIVAAVPILLILFSDKKGKKK
jgi:hypothetical protein